MGGAGHGSEPVDPTNVSNRCSGRGHGREWRDGWSTGEPGVNVGVLEPKGTKPEGTIAGHSVV